MRIDIMNKKLSFLLFFLSFLLLAQSSYSLFHAITSFTPDFSIFYGAGLHTIHNKSVYHDLSLFTLFNYPLITAFLYIPFTFFPYNVAQVLFATLSISAGILSVILSLKIIKKSFPFPLLIFVISLFLFVFPTKFTIGMGQSNLIGYACLLSSYYFYERYAFKRSLFLFVLAVLFKPVFGFLLLFYLLKKDLRYVFFSLISICAFIFLLPFLFGKGREVIVYVGDIIPHLLTMTGREIYYNQGLSGFAARLIPSLSLRSLVTNTTTLALLITLWLYRKANSTTLFSLLLTVLVIIDALSWQHHFVFLLLPFLFTITQIIKHKQPVMLLLLFLSLVLVTINLKTPSLLHQFPASLFLSHTFYGAVLLFLLQLRLMKTSKQNYHL